MSRRPSVKKIILTLFGFIVFWAVITDAWGYSDRIFKNAPYNTGADIYGCVIRLIWVIPAILLIIKYGDKLMIHKKVLFLKPQCNKSLLLVITASLVYIIAGMLISHGGFWFNSGINPGLAFVKYVIVGFVEEAVFRGWGYNSLANILSCRSAAVISAILFVVLHWPAYFIKFFRFGVFDFAGILGQSSSALIWGFVFCWLLKKGRTIWNPIIAHIVYDLMFVLLIG